MDLTDSNISIPDSNNPTRKEVGLNKDIYDSFDNEPWLHNSSQDITQLKMMKVDRDLLFQIIMIEDISKSKQSQFDELSTRIDPKNQRVDTLRNSKGPKKFDIVTQVDLDNDNDTPTNNNNALGSGSNKKTVYKMTIQSKRSDIFSAITTFPFDTKGCYWGSKIIIKKGTIFNRGVFYLKEENIVKCFGRIQNWMENQELKMHFYLEEKLKRDNETNSSNGSQSTNSTNSRKRKVSQID
ncbi:hypothetical protein C6P45_002064 [Maudiozyma exigua]|uniref:RecQ mediated genome instability protein 1 OB-fold domain-containing protein n=1 Tax=Maudiozyma exigua TaxID=34358 RepID=A0A9P7B590_MAUEX|nr:hypothetical protein C6P45_002064 [Kazachstania exigua]